VTSGTNTLVCLVDHEDSRAVCLHLATDEKNQLWDQRLGQPLETLQPDEQYVEKSLGKLLEVVKPTYAAKRVLGVILVRSILHLLEGPWVSRSLCIDDISLFCKIQNDQPYPFFDKVFLSTAFKENDTQCRSQAGRRGAYSVHPFPTILALGIVLTEIELGDELPGIYSQLSFAKLRNRPFDLAKNLLRECELRLHLESGLLRAVKFCIDRTSFLRFANESSEALFADQEFVNTYYMGAVRPLEEDLVNGAKWTWDEVSWLQRRNLDDKGICKIITKLGNEIELNLNNSRQEQKRQKWDQTPGGASALMSISEEADGARNLNEIQQNPFSGASRPVIPGGHQMQFSNMSEFFSSLPLTRSTTWSEPLEDKHTQTQDSSRPNSRDDFEIAIICALPLEANAVLRAFDKLWDEDLYAYGRESNDSNSYSVGAMGGRNVVLVHPPGIGKATAASVAVACAMSFKNVKLALVVGICGGVPLKSNKEEILLGDVVVSKAVIQYDLGRQFPDHFRPKTAIEDSLGRPNARICSLLAKLETNIHGNNFQNKISDILTKLDCDGSSYPEDAGDKLFKSAYRHKHQDPRSCGVCTNCKRNTDPVCEDALKSSCQDTGCDDAQLVRHRRQNQKNKPMVHIGLMASGDSVVRSGAHRDKVAKEANVIAFEMEGAGVWYTFPCVIIKGVCDYADSHKNKLWQEYAAATAAACTQAFIQHW
jgi:nucleoside phosphorylase